MATLRPTRPRYVNPSAPAKAGKPSLTGGFEETLPRRKDKDATRKSRTATYKRAGVREAAIAPVQERVLPVCLVLTVAYLALAGRCFFLQILQNKEITKQAIQIRRNAKALPARRGILLDRNGLLLVQNEPTCTIVIDPNAWFATKGKADKKDTPEKLQERAIEGLSRILTDVNVAAVVAERGLVKGSTGRYRTIDVAPQRPVGVGELVKEARLLGVGVFPSARRTAVDGDLAPHVIGFTRKSGEGGGGLEYGLEDSLTGIEGWMEAEFDNLKRVIPGTIRTYKPEKHGDNIVLTLDSDLQHIVQDELKKACLGSKAEAATAIVLDPQTGDILALANFPAYNVNDWKNAPGYARINRAVSAPYEPGSTLKTFTLAAALEDRKITPDSTFFCSGSKIIGRRTIHDHNFEKHGMENTTDVLCNSCNIGTAEIAFDLGKVRLYHYLTAFGFGKKTGSGLPGESRGLLAPPEKWPNIQLANIAFGQGISVTPLQLTTAYAAIANDGVRVRPRIVRGLMDETGEIRELPMEDGVRVLSVDTARTMKKMLHAVIEEGTGRPARLEGYTAGGKTGTAQLVERGAKGYGSTFVASFAGMAPANTPQFVCLVAVTKPQGKHYGGQVAGPVVKTILEKALIARRIPRDAPIRASNNSRTTTVD